MEVYVGIKFEAVCRGKKAPASITSIYSGLKRTCDRLKTHEMAYSNDGNISIRHKNGFIITCSGSQLGSIKEKDLVFVERCDAENRKVFYHGPTKPSSEAMMHSIIYSARPEAKVIIHAHDKVATGASLIANAIEESDREEPYGTPELARLAIKALEKAGPTLHKEGRIIFLKNHGFVAIASNLDNACNVIIHSHKNILAVQN